MDAAMIMASAAAVVAVASIGITLVVLNRFRGRRVSDEGAAGLGETRTLRSIRSGGSRWESFFYPDDQENEGTRPQPRTP